MHCFSMVVSCMDHRLTVCRGTSQNINYIYKCVRKERKNTVETADN